MVIGNVHKCSLKEFGSLSESKRVHKNDRLEIHTKSHFYQMGEKNYSQGSGHGEKTIG